MVFFQIQERLPIVWSKDYNVAFCGLQCLYPFDTEKGQHVLQLLKVSGLVKEDNIYRPLEMNEDELLEVHSFDYLQSLKISDNVAKIAEIPLLHFVPNVFVQSSYLKPMRFQAGGTVKACKLALKHGWAINLGGGFNHCSSDHGGSFSPYADMSLAVKSILLDQSNNVRRIMIIDLSSRQGNGHERDLMDIKSVYIFDMYNHTLYPKDEQAKMAISRKVELPSHTEDEVYLRKLRINLLKAFEEFTPDFVLYNAGTDVVEGDDLGELCVSPSGIVARDEIVFTKVRGLQIPIAMVLGTGFVRSSAEIIASSIINLKEKGFLPSKMWER
ncbi:histone deacetylase 11-like [Condylostylus longicornis]|uniref:histone deacetylase 11-like n=1 Tax=Condylostylus longicornis TaxID=2530218 RepID=UPI00244E355D|nr:histone deacetylase 11-like [Condylostylus longicornis]